MASGILGQSNITAQATHTAVYTVPTGKVATLNIGIVNRALVSAVVRIALATSTSPSAAEFIEYDFFLATHDVFERGGLVLDAGKKVVVYITSASPDVTVCVTGYEE
jgi:hypothetical protein